MNFAESAFPATAAGGAASAAVLDFLLVAGGLKRTKRAGWLRSIPPSEVESVADHSFRVAAHFLALRDEMLFVDGFLANRQKCLTMALVHDLAESTVGDITPHDGIPESEKRDREERALRSIAASVDEAQGKTLLSLWFEYEEGKSPEARLVKEADKFEMLVQAYEYEQTHGVNLQEFFTSTQGFFKTEAFKALSTELLQRRERERKS